MHIPDGYIGPQTYGAAYAIMIPVWAVASRVLKKSLSRKQIPLIALGAAFSFVVMFLNIPVMGRMTAHPAGAGLVAIVCGPWAACIAISAALLVQAVPFGDGGITTFAANCLNLAVIAPFVTWGVFRVIMGIGNPLTPTLSRGGERENSPHPNPLPQGEREPEGGRRLWLASAVAGYAGIVAAAAAVGIEVGLQPAIAGPGMYLPYSIGTALLAMLVPHVLIIGPLEGALTAAATAYIHRTEPWVLAPGPRPLTPVRRLLVVAVVIALLVPVGIILPAMFGAGPAWGEWGVGELKDMFGYVPHGISSGLEFWKAPLADYSLPGRDAGPTWIVLMAFAGGLAALAVGWGIGRLIVRGGKNAAS